jgi:hypothetical protein
LALSARNAVRALKAEAAKALPVLPQAADDLARKTGLSCANAECNATVDGTQNSRFRGDRCEPCYRYWRRNDQERPWRLVIREAGKQ